MRIALAMSCVAAFTFGHAKAYEAPFTITQTVTVQQIMFPRGDASHQLVTLETFRACNEQFRTATPETVVVAGTEVWLRCEVEAVAPQVEPEDEFGSSQCVKSTELCIMFSRSMTEADLNAAGHTLQGLDAKNDLLDLSEVDEAPAWVWLTPSYDF